MSTADGGSVGATGSATGKQPPPLTAAPDDARGGGSPAASPSSSAPASSAPPPVAAPGDDGRRVRELQARLAQIAWYFGPGPSGEYDSATVKAVKGFQTKRGLPSTGTTDRATWGRLTGMTGKPTYFQLYAAGDQPPAKPDKRCLTGRVLCISKTSRTLTWMVDGKAVSTMDVRFGSQYTPTREGEFTVYWKSRHHVSTLYDTPMPYALFFSGGQAVHYSSDFAAAGYTGASHGCVNVRKKERIASLFAQVRKGDKVVVYR
nr:L,D-transpeptidase family protein [Streptomyces triticagri]